MRRNPYKGHILHGSLKGARALEFTLPSGAHRAAYVISYETRECIVFMVGPHENFYRDAERRLDALRKSGVIRES